MWYEKISEVWAVVTVEPIQQSHFRLPDLFNLICQIPTDYDTLGNPYDHTLYLNIIAAPPKIRFVGSRANAADYDVTEIFNRLRVCSYTHLGALHKVHGTEGQGKLWQD